MMNSRSLLDERVGAQHYRSATTVDSKRYPGVSFDVARMSFGRRTELIRKVREIAAPLECLASSDDEQEKLDAQLLSQQVDNVFLSWGLVSISGLLIDGEPANPDTMLAKGPVDLATEIVSAVKHACGLSDDERKNS